MEKELLAGIKLEKKPGSEVAFSGEIPFSELEKHRASALAAVGKEISIDGFRKGHVPEAVLVKTVGEMAILTEMAERAIAKLYPLLVAHHNLDVIGYPKISITKLAKDNPLGFTLAVAVVPEVTLPDYEKIAKELNAKKESKEVTEEEVTKQIEDILRQKAAYERLQKKAVANADHVHGPDCDHKVNAEGREGALGHEHEHTDGETDDLKLPELTDEYVKSLGKEGQFTGVEDFRNKIREHLTIQKAQDVDSKHRANITDAIIEKSKMELPQVLVDAEIGQMYAQMEGDLKRAELKVDDYLTHIKKTKEELISEWRPSAEKRAKLQLVLNAIAKKENVTPDPSLVDHEVSHLLEHYKDADEKRVRTYVTSVLTNDAVMKRLEDAK